MSNEFCVASQTSYSSMANEPRNKSSNAYSAPHENSADSHNGNSPRGVIRDISKETGNFSTSSHVVKDCLAEFFSNAVNLKVNRKSGQILPSCLDEKVYNKGDVLSHEVHTSTVKGQSVAHDSCRTWSREDEMHAHSQRDQIEGAFTNVGHFSATASNDAVSEWLDKHFP